MSTHIKLVAVFADNTLGQMARITGVLEQAGVNIRWMTIATSETFGVIKLLLDRPTAAARALRAAGYSVTLVPVLAIEIRDRPGGLHTVARVLAENKVNVDNSSGFVIKSRRSAVVLIEVKDWARARRVLRRCAIPTLAARDLQNL